MAVCKYTLRVLCVLCVMAAVVSAAATDATAAVSTFPLFNSNDVKNYKRNITFIPVLRSF